jgi:gamma-glutamylputrescine oxidase
VALLERDYCGAGASGLSSGFITPASELELADVVASSGAERGAALWSFVEGGVETIRDTILRLGLDCDYEVQDSLFVAEDARGVARAQDEHAARLALGRPSTLYGGAELARVVGTGAFAAGVRYPGTFGIDSYRYCRGVRDALEAAGVLVFEGTAAVEAGRGRVRTEDHTVTAAHVVACADRWMPGLGLLDDQVGQVQTFLAATEPLRDEQARALFPDGPLMVWDSRLTYDYFRLTGDRRLLVGGANLWHTYARRERHDAGPNLRPLAAFLSRTFPGLEVRWERVWPGMLGVSKDFLPVAGRDPDDPTLTCIGAAAGLPWAAALGRHFAEAIVAGGDGGIPELSPSRRGVRPTPLNRLLAGRGALAIAHGTLAVRSRYRRRG